MKVFSALSVVVAVLLAVASAHRGTATLSRKCVAFIRDNFRNIYTKILQLEEEMKQQMDKAVNGDWGSWSDWSPCSSSCGAGLSRRKRSCDNPPPSFNGHPCSDDATDYKACEEMACQVDGDWGSWSDWSPCSSSCGAGLSRRQRSCDNPPPSFNGHPCSGDATDYKVCEEMACQGIQSAFTVRSPVIVGTGSTGISFQFTTTNVGGNFDNATGVFTCEHPGVYVFHLHISTNLNQDQAYCSIRLNGYSDLVRAHSTISSSDTGGGGYIGSSNTLTVHLNAGDTIDVGYCTEIESFYTAKSTTFSGYLLVPDP